ncbi:MAG TPA: glycerol-3-phosphate acyltransferase [Dehalococcoidales bacterium]|nr:glycerol-3-phosphate acyltransferase [Dehalococcoidales bacterium]
MNNHIALIIVAIVCAYVIGSIPSAYIMGRLRKGVDIRQIGSRSMGAMNVFYQIGFVEGLTVLAVDIGKGMAVVALARWLGVPLYAQLLAAAAVVVGHAYTVFLKFRGGRGGATCIGILVYLMPWGLPLYAAIFGLSLLLTRYPTLSYSLAFLCFPFVAWLKYHSVEFIVFSIGILLIPGIKYIPRIKEMRSSGGSWRHVLLRRNLKDRL